MCKSRTTFKALQLKLMLVFFFLKKKIYHFHGNRYFVVISHQVSSMALH